MNADAKAFAAVMRHIKKVDAQQHTVVMMTAVGPLGLASFAATTTFCPSGQADLQTSRGSDAAATFG